MVRVLNVAADCGLARAQNNLGVCYANGSDVTQDAEKAVEWYRLAAEQGYASIIRTLSCVSVSDLQGIHPALTSKLARQDAFR